MAILFDSTNRVKTTARRRRLFGSGIFQSLPVYRAPASFADMEWWARHGNPEREDAEDFDYWAAVSEAQDRIENGRDL